MLEMIQIWHCSKGWLSNGSNGIMNERYYKYLTKDAYNINTNIYGHMTPGNNFNQAG